MHGRVIVGTVAAWGLLWAMASCSEDPDSASPTAASDGASSRGQDPTPSSPSPEPSSSGPADLSALGEDELDAGAYAFSPFGAAPEMPVPVMKVPAGFAGFRGFGVAAARGSGFRSVAVWTVDTVDLQPCTAAGSTPIGPSPADLAAALSRQRLTTTSRPATIELGGHEGIHLEVTAPTGRKFSDCGESFDLWSNDGGGMRYLQGPGQVDSLWILDLPGERLVIDATYTQGATEEQVRELTAIVEGVRFQSPVTS